MDLYAPPAASASTRSSSARATVTPWAMARVRRSRRPSPGIRAAPFAVLSDQQLQKGVGAFGGGVAWLADDPEEMFGFRLASLILVVRQ